LAKAELLFDLKNVSTVRRVVLTGVHDYEGGIEVELESDAGDYELRNYCTGA